MNFLYDTAEIMVQYPTIPCNDCKYCMPCPYGLDIPGVFVHYNKCANEGNVPENQQAKNYHEAQGISCGLRQECAETASGKSLHRMQKVCGTLPAKHRDSARDAVH